MIGPTEAALACWLSWLVGACYGAYRYERLWLDRDLADIVRDLRRT